MPFEKGNTLGTKTKLFEGALRRAIAQDDGKRLRQAAEQLLTQAAEGEQWAIGMLADRLDGKASQAVEVTHRKPLEELSLDELRDRVAGMLAGTGQPQASADQPSGVH
jgi:hypothetical protein